MCPRCIHPHTVAQYIGLAENDLFCRSVEIGHKDRLCGARTHAENNKRHYVGKKKTEKTHLERLTREYVFTRSNGTFVYIFYVSIPIFRILVQRCIQTTRGRTKEKDLAVL